MEEVERIYYIMTSLAHGWSGVPFPFEPVDTKTTLGTYAVTARTDVNDIGGTFNLGHETLQRSYRVYERTLGRLASIGERVEEKLGFEPLPAPNLP